MKKYDNISVHENMPLTRYIIGINVWCGEYLVRYNVARVDSDCFFFIGSSTLIETSHGLSIIFRTDFKYVGD